MHRLIDNGHITRSPRYLTMLRSFCRFEFAFQDTADYLGVSQGSLTKWLTDGRFSHQLVFSVFPRLQALTRGIEAHSPTAQLNISPDKNNMNGQIVAPASGTRTPEEGSQRYSGSQPPIANLNDPPALLL